MAAGVTGKGKRMDPEDIMAGLELALQRYREAEGPGARGEALVGVFTECEVLLGLRQPTR